MKFSKIMAFAIALAGLFSTTVQAEKVKVKNSSDKIIHYYVFTEDRKYGYIVYPGEKSFIGGLAKDGKVVLSTGDMIGYVVTDKPEVTLDATIKKVTSPAGATRREIEFTEEYTKE